MSILYIKDFSYQNQMLVLMYLIKIYERKNIGEKKKGFLRLGTCGRCDTSICYFRVVYVFILPCFMKGERMPPLFVSTCERKNAVSVIDV